MLELPAFPWDALDSSRQVARSHSGGVCDLSVGTPTDPVPDLIREALRESANTPGYPTAQGSHALRVAAVGWLDRRLGVPGVDPEDVLAVIGTKEFVAWLPTILDQSARNLVVVPELAYPTYAIGARIAGCRTLPADSLVQLGPERPGLIWINSPANPTGKVLGPDHLKKVVAWARERGVVVASDECYIEFGWSDQPVSILDPLVSGGTHDGLLAVHSLSKRSNMAGYRCGLVAGDAELVAGLVNVSKHAGMMVPAPVQAAAAVAWADDAHVADQRARYRRRRGLMVEAFTDAGYRIDDSDAGLYLWATRGEPCWDTVARLAALGILVAPGSIFGPRGARHVRVSLTAQDDRVEAACKRLVEDAGIAAS